MGTNDFLVMLAVFLFLAIYGIWKYDKSEQSDYKKFVDKAAELNMRMTKLEKHCLEENSAVFVNALTRIEQLETKTTLIGVENDQLQDHCARLRKSQIDLRDRSYPRYIEITFPDQPTGAIPFEIRGPTKPIKAKPPTPPHTKKLLKKTAKQIKGLSK